MKRNYKTEYFKVGFMGNRYKIGESEYSASNKEVELHGSITNVGIAKCKALHRHFTAPVTTYSSITTEVNKSIIVKIVDFIGGMKIKVFGES